MNKNTIISYVIFILIATSCFKAKEGNALKRIDINTVINKSGTFEFINTDIFIEAIILSSGLLEYKIITSNGTKTYVATRTFNAMQKWGITVDGNGKVWIYSSDIGVGVWEKENEKDYVYFDDLSKNKEKFVGMPSSIINLAPSVLRQFEL